MDLKAYCFSIKDVSLLMHMAAFWCSLGTGLQYLSYMSIQIQCSLMIKYLSNFNWLKFDLSSFHSRKDIHNLFPFCMMMQMSREIRELTNQRDLAQSRIHNFPSSASWVRVVSLERAHKLFNS